MTLPLELHQQIAKHLSQGGAKVDLSHLSQTCKHLALIHQPILFEDLRLNRVRGALLAATYAVFTKPVLANAVYHVQLPDLWIAPAPQKWPPYVDLQPLRDGVAAALGDQSHEVVETATQLVCAGQREDLIAMLLLTRTPHLDTLTLRAVGQRGDETLARAIFQTAAARLYRLAVVELGIPPHENELPARDEEGDLSYAYLVDMLRLPAVASMHAHKFGPSEIQRPLMERLARCFKPIGDLATSSTSLQWLILSEHYASRYAYLGNLLQHLPALEWLEFLPADKYVKTSTVHCPSG